MGTRRASSGRALVLFFAALALGGVVGRRAAADAAPVSLVDWRKAKGEDSSLGVRRVLFARLVGGEAYVVSAEMNGRLLQALRAASGAALAGVNGGGGGGAQIRKTARGDFEVTYDLSSLVLNLEFPEDTGYASVGRIDPTSPAPAERIDEPTLLPRLLAGNSTFVCAAVLSQKAKQFDDGLYAAVEEAFEGGADGKRRLLLRLRERFGAAGARDAGAQVSTRPADGRDEPDARRARLRPRGGDADPRREKAPHALRRRVQPPPTRDRAREARGGGRAPGHARRASGPRARDDPSHAAAPRGEVTRMGASARGRMPLSGATR